MPRVDVRRRCNRRNKSLRVQWYGLGPALERRYLVNGSQMLVSLGGGDIAMPHDFFSNRFGFTKLCH
jgi:hypothetical protein